jgi:hypothetical protein
MVSEKSETPYLALSGFSTISGLISVTPRFDKAAIGFRILPSGTAFTVCNVPIPIEELSSRVRDVNSNSCQLWCSDVASCSVVLVSDAYYSMGCRSHRSGGQYRIWYSTISSIPLTIFHILLLKPLLSFLIPYLDCSHTN